MDTLRLSLLAVFCLGPSLAVSPVTIPLAFEHRDPGLFVAYSGGNSLHFQADRVTIGDVTLRFEHARPGARLEGIGPAAPANYIDATSRRTFPQFPRLAARGLYRGIDAVFYGSAGQLEYDLEIAPGASPTRVRLRFENARRVRLDGDGSLVVETAAGELRQLPPRVVQSGRTVPAHYHLTGANQAAIRIGAYDRSRPLTIDPVLTYARYFGGSGSDSASAVGADSQGNVYVAGRSSSRDFPSTSPSSAKPTSPLIAVSSAGQKIAQLPIGNASSVTAIGGTPDGQILYAAAGSNVFYSSNGGASWRQTAALPAPIFAPISTPLTINSISVDAIDPSRAYVASNKGIFATADNGQTWGSHDYGLVANYDSSITASSVTVSQVDHTILYAATGQPNFIYKSTTAAGTWQILYPAYPGEPAPSIYSIQPIVYALLPGGSDLYVVDGNSILLKSTDGGATWQKLADQLFGTRSIQIDPVTGNILLLDNQGAQLSTDGGHTFATVNPPGAHNMDVSAAAFEGTSHTLYEAALGSVYATADLGSTWQAAALPPMNVHTMQAFGGLVFVGLDTPQATFLVKFDSTGTNLLYSTFFIGTPLDYVAAMQVDGQAEVYLAGYTMSQNFAGANRIGQPAPLPYFNSYVAKIAADGSTLVYLTILGGSKGSFVAALALDSAGAAYLTGETGSPDFPNTPNAAQPKPPSTACTRPTDFYFDIINVQAWAFAGKLSPDGTSMVYSTFLTGSCGSVGSSIAVNPAGEAFVGGTTTSPDMPFPTTAYQSTFPGPLDKTGYPNAADAGFGAHLSAAGDQVLGGTYIGGGYLTSVNALALDGSGNVLLTGSTWGIAPGATTGAYQTSVVYRCGEPISIGPAHSPEEGSDAYVLKLDSTFSKTGYLTYLGGSCYDTGTSIGLDPSGNVWVSGRTSSSDFPLLAPFQVAGGSGFISELSPAGAKLLFSSLTDGTAMAISPQGSVYLAGFTYLPVIPKAAGYNSTAFLGRIDPAPAPPILIGAIGSMGLANGGAPQPVISAGVAPGELIQIAGQKLGPATKVMAQLDSSNRLPFSVAGTAVTFDGIAAPLISVQDGAIVCFVPFAVSAATEVTVKSSAGQSNAVRVPVSPAQPEILAIANQDGTPNSANNPAAQGSVITVYVSGLGQTNPPGVDGQVNAAPAAVPLAPVTVYVAGMPAMPQYVAAAVGLVAGISQVNVQVPSGKYPPTNSVSVNQAFAPLYIAAQ